MSHFTVLVIGNDVEEQLEPYFELECQFSQEEMKNDHRSEFIVEHESISDLEKDWKIHNNENPNYFYNTPEEYIEDWNGLIEHDGKYGRFTNPNSKWDWYLVGGRWTGFFKSKKNPKYPDDILTGEAGLMTESAKPSFCDSIRLCDVDFDGMKDKKKEDRKKYWDKAFKEFHDNPGHRKNIYGIDDNDTKESYINKNINFSTYAVLKDGEWYEKGQMGWFGISIDEQDDWNEQFDKLINGLPGDTLLTIVDCHI